jgi:hypothetical protein
MTAAELLAQLKTQGFLLEVCDEGIGIEPASKLTDIQIRAIRVHKPKLMVLLSGEPPPKVQVTAPEKRKPRKRGAKTPAQTDSHEEPPPTAPQAALPPAAIGAVRSPEPDEAPAPSAAVEQIACRVCGSPVFNPKEERCWHCGNIVDSLMESVIRRDGGK